MSQQYSLRWNNHQPNFISMFTTLLNTQTLVDVTLAAEGKHLQAHKVVLSACSTYFQALFVDNPSRHPIVILKDVTFADLRTMVDFMYYGEVNVTEEQLPQVLDTAKLLKIKGLTEMPDSTSLTRSQGTSAEFQSPGDSIDSQRHSASPATSPSNKRKRFVRRKSSTGSASLNMVMGEDNRHEEPQNLELMRGETITLSSVPQHRRRDYHDDRAMDNAQQNTDPQNLNVEPVTMEANSAGLPQGAQWSMMEHAYPRYTNACLGGGGPLQPDTGIYMNNVIDHHLDPDMNDYAQVSGCNAEPQSYLKVRRVKHLKRQERVQPDERGVHRQASEPTVTLKPSLPILQKHESYPQYNISKNQKAKVTEPEIGSLLIRTVAVLGRRTSTNTTTASTSYDSTAFDLQGTKRASHTPAVRSGPPLSCHFCWNTVDDCGRILRRKTQYHCPECRTNLCIVPCFHEYHVSHCTA